MTLKARFAVAVTMASVAFAATASTATAQTDTPAPTVTLSLAAATVGQAVNVTGTSFPPSASVSLQLCGDEARNGSTDCDVVAGQTVVTDEHGVFQGHIVVRFPPVPCPCVVWATSNGSAPASATAAIGVVSAVYTPAPVDTAPTTTSPQLTVVRAAPHPRNSWRGWFGLPTQVDLEVTLRNDGTSRIEEPVLTLTTGKSDDPIRLVPSPAIEPLGPGEERTIVVPVDLGALAIGRYTFKGTVGGSDVAFRVHTSVVPWMLGLFVVAGLVLVVLRIRRRRRVRRAAESAVVTEAAIEAPLPEPALVGVGVGAVAAPSSVDALPATNGSAPRVLVTFTFPSWTTAETVSLCGDFNDWAADAHPMTRTSDGSWEVAVLLKGSWSYRYRFLLDGSRWENDWAPDAFLANAFGSRDSVVVVGQHDRFADASASTRRPEAPVDDFDIEFHDDLESTFEGFWSEESDAIRTKVRRWLR